MGTSPEGDTDAAELFALWRWQQSPQIGHKSGIFMSRTTWAQSLVPGGSRCV